MIRSLAALILNFIFAIIELKLVQLCNGSCLISLAFGAVVAALILFGNTAFACAALGTFLGFFALGMSPLDAAIATAAYAAGAKVAEAVYTRLRFTQSFYKDLTDAFRIVVSIAGGSVAASALRDAALSIIGVIQISGLYSEFVKGTLGNMAGAFALLPLALTVGGKTPERIPHKHYNLLGAACTAVVIAFSIASLFFTSVRDFFFIALGITSLFALVAPKRVTLSVCALIVLGVIFRLAYLPAAFLDGMIEENIRSVQVFIGVLFAGPLILPSIQENDRRTRRVAGIVLLFSVVGAALLYGTLRASARAENRFHKRQIAAGIEAQINQRIQSYENAIRGGEGLYAASSSVEPPEWTAYVNSLHLQDRYPGVYGIGILRPVKQAQLSSYLAAARSMLGPDFQIRPMAGTDTTNIEEHLILELAEPRDRNIDNLGRDAGAEPNRRAAANKARDTGSLTMTKISDFTPDGQHKPGTVLYMPHYKGGEIPRTVEERRNRLELWIAMRCDIWSIFSNLNRQLTDEMRFSVYPDGAAQDTLPIFRSTDNHVALGGTLETRLKIIDQEFTIAWAKNSGFTNASQGAAVWAGILALLSGFALTILVANTSSFQGKAEAIVSTRTSELKTHRDELIIQSESLQSQSKLLEAARDQALAATQEKSKFLASMSHEIRTPLASILGFAEALSEQTMSVDERVAASQSIFRSGQHLRTVIDDILDLSKIEAGRIELEILETPLFDLISDVVRMTKVPALEKGLQFLVEPEFPLPRNIRTDPTRLKQAICNLLNNAVKFTKSGHVKLSVSFDSVKELLIFTVRDSGIGLSNEQKKRIFEPFRQAASSTTREYGGTGLGLSITREIVSLMGGTVSVENNAPCGSTFVIQVPTGKIDPNSLTWQTIPSGTRPSSNPNSVKLKGRVLVAEDGAENREFISFMLRKFGIEYELVEDGLAAVEAAQRRQFDLVLMDLHMPKLAGYQATKILRDQGYRQPIVALSANILKENVQRSLESGCNDFMGKPFTTEMFLGILSKYLGTSTANQQEAPPEDTAPVTTLDLLSESPGLVSVVNLFFERAAPQLTALETAFLHGQWDELQTLAHRLKGAAANLRFEEIRKAAYDLEQSAGQKSQDKAARALSELEIEIERGALWWRDYQSKQTTPHSRA